MIDTIVSKANPKVKEAYALRASPRPESFLIEGFHLVEMAFEAHALLEVFAETDPHLEGVSVHLVGHEVIEKLSLSRNPEPIVGIAKAPNLHFEAPRCLVLDRVQDPGNVGTLLRTALSFGFKNVVFLPGSCSPYNAKAIASSQGAIFGLELAFPASESEAVALLRKEGYALLGTALENAVPAEGFSAPQGKIALILGNEGRGMAESLKKECDALLRISMQGIDSLNVGVAGGILMHQFSCLMQEGK